MKAHVLQHVPFEGIGSIAAWLEGQKAEVSYTRFFEAAPLPSLDAVELIIVMGGPMSANDEDRLTWLKSEKQFIRDAIVRDISVLGVCLGAQMIASTLGARVYRSPVKEIGWFPVRAVPAPEGSFRFPEECMAFHWHAETFDLPQGARHLARSSGCENQAFQIKQNVIGLQFHLETTRNNMLALVENCREELVPGPYIQSEDALRAVPNASYQAINTLMGDILSYLTLANDGVGQ
jgi:GMP synthase-like glutamine amidotransferase